MEDGVQGASSAEVLAEYQKKLEEQKQQLLLGTSEYSDKVSGTGVKTQIVHEDGKVFYVYNLLFKITDDLEAKYTAFKDEKVANDEALEAYHNSLIDQTRLYVSNVEYDKDAECEEEECTCTACVNYKADATDPAPGPCTDPDCTCKKCPNKRFITKEFAEEHGIAVKDDTIGIKDALDALYEDLGTVGTTDGERAAMLQKFQTWVYMLNDDEGFFTTLSDGKLGYELSMDDSSYVESFTELSRLLAYGTQAEKDAHAEYKIVGTGIGSYGYCYTEYGIHVIMLSGYALEDSAAAGVSDLGNGLYAVAADTIVDYASYKAADAGEYAEGTLAYDIKETLDENAKSEKVGAFKKAFYQKELEESVKIKYYDVYKDLIKQYQNQ